jgi:hypothetical protein
MIFPPKVPHALSWQRRQLTLSSVSKLGGGRLPRQVLGLLPGRDRYDFDGSADHVGWAILAGGSLESVRKHQAGLQSFRSIRRIEARRRNASALRLRFSQSLASLRQRLSQAMVRSTIQRLGNTTNPLA